MHLTAIETPEDVAQALTKQAEDIRKKIDQLKDSLEAIEQLEGGSAANADSKFQKIRRYNCKFADEK